MIEQLGKLMRESPIGEAMRSSAGLFPACETAHFIGLSLLLGAMIAIDLRVLGFFRTTSYSSVLKLIPLAILGFAINLVSGACLIAANPELYFTNPAFYWKMALILVAGLNAAWFTVAEHSVIANLSAEDPAPAGARMMAATSLGVWVLVLLLGRLLPTFAPVAGG